MDLESLFTESHGFGLTTATPLQRAACRIISGEPLGELASNPVVVEAVGGQAAVEALPNEPPSEVVLTAAIRSAKTLLIAALAFRASQICDLSRLRPGEVPRFNVVSLDKDKAKATLEHLGGTLEASPLLSQVVLESKAESILLQHPSGRPVEVYVAAGRKAGGSLVARWSIGCAFDEAPRMQGQEDGVINLEDGLTAVRGRMLPGAQIFMFGSPWAPRGPVYDKYIEHFGRPSKTCVYIKAKGPDMNPLHFTPEHCAKLLKTDPRAHRTDVLAEFADGEEQLLSSINVEACQRRQPETLPPTPGWHYTAAIDPATRGNAWTLVVTTRGHDMRQRVALATQWIGSKSAPLRPKLVFKEIAEILKPYGLTDVWSDQWSFDSNLDLAEDAGLTLLPYELSDTEWRSLSKLLENAINEHTLELPPSGAMRADLIGVKKRVTPRSFSVVLPKTGDGRHGDYVPPLCVCLKYAPEPPSAPKLASTWDPDIDEQRVLEKLRAAEQDGAAGAIAGGDSWT